MKAAYSELTDSQALCLSLAFNCKAMSRYLFIFFFQLYSLAASGTPRRSGPRSEVGAEGTDGVECVTGMFCDTANGYAWANIMGLGRVIDCV